MYSIHQEWVTQWGEAWWNHSRSLCSFRQRPTPTGVWASSNSVEMTSFGVCVCVCSRVWRSTKWLGGQSRWGVVQLLVEMVHSSSTAQSCGHQTDVRKAAVLRAYYISRTRTHKHACAQMTSYRAQCTTRTDECHLSTWEVYLCATVFLTQTHAHTQARCVQPVETQWQFQKCYFLIRRQTYT